jgi:hypothetical protein
MTLDTSVKKFIELAGVFAPSVSKSRWLAVVIF